MVAGLRGQQRGVRRRVAGPLNASSGLVIIPSRFAAGENAQAQTLRQNPAVLRLAQVTEDKEGCQYIFDKFIS